MPSLLQPATGLFVLESGRLTSHRDIVFASGEEAAEGDADPEGSFFSVGGGAHGPVTHRVEVDTLVARDIFGHESILSQSKNVV